MSLEHDRLLKDGDNWRRWGPYLAERAWGTVREDYSPNGDAWNYFPHDHARESIAGMKTVCSASLTTKGECVSRWRDYILFYEYFHGDNGAGIGASPQTGWTGLIAKLIQQQGERGTWSVNGA